MKGMTLVDWRKRRNDRRTEAYWRRISEQRELNSFERYQIKWNFTETDYGHTLSNNGLDMANPGFAYDTKLAKYLRPFDTETGVRSHDEEY